MTNEIDVFDDRFQETASAHEVADGKLIATALINQRIGRKAVIDAFSKLLTVSDLIDLKKIKETKEYKGAQLIVDGKLLTVSSWQEYCDYIEKKSHKSIDLDLLNLDALGEPLFESMRNIGLGPSTMREIRKLPSADREVIEQVAKTSNKDELIDLIDGLVAKHAKEKTELADRANTLEQDLKDSGKRINNMNAEIERQELQLERLGKKKERLTKFEELTEDVRDECMHLQAGCEHNLNSLHKLFDDCMWGNGAETPEQQLRIEQIYVAVSVAASRAVTILELMRDVIPEASRPVRIQAQHILTPEEAQRWSLDYSMIENKHNAEKVARDTKRELDKPKGRGRPAGSKNKAEE